MYPNAKVTHLTWCHSNHCPVLLETQPRTYNGRIRPFMFQTGWLLDPSFFLIVYQVWERNNKLVYAINCFTQKAKEWNKNQFGNIFTRKKNLMLRLNGIQRALALRPSDFLVKLEDELLKELDHVLNQEEELWALKSKVNWMVQGDLNMTFYYVSTLIRQKRNQIMVIKNAMGDWIHEEGEIKDFIRSGFDLIFLSSLSCVTRMDPTIYQWQPRLSDLEKESINKGASEEEIKASPLVFETFQGPRPGWASCRVLSKNLGYCGKFRDR